jgi:hypothetical protein
MSVWSDLLIETENLVFDALELGAKTNEDVLAYVMMNSSYHVDEDLITSVVNKTMSYLTGDYYEYHSTVH